MTEPFGTTPSPGERRSIIFPRPSIPGPAPAKPPTIPASEAMVAALLDANPTPAVILTPVGEVVRTNRLFAQQFVLRAERLAGMPFVECLVPTSREAVERTLGRLRKGESVREEIDAFLRASDSHQPAVRLTFLPLGEGESFVGVVVTVRERIDPLPVSSTPPVADEYYQLLFASNPVPMYIFDVETLRFLDVNEAMRRHYGYSRDEFRSMNLKEIRPPEEVPRLLRSLDIFRDHHYPPTPWVHRHKDGTLFHMEVTTHVIRFEGRRCRLALAQDVTQRIRSQKTLEEREQLLRSLGDNLPGGAIYQYLVPVGTSGIYTYISQGISRMCGFTPEDLTSGRVRFRDWMKKEDHDGMSDAVLRSMQTLEPISVEVAMQLPDGSEPIWQWRAEAYRLTDGGIGWDGIIIDVTEQRRLESQVQQAQKFQTISVLAGGIAHDFNNLLTGILGFADLAAMELPADEPVREYMVSIVQSAQRAAELCQQMLAYAGQGRYLVGPIQLSSLVREMVRLLKTVISKKAELKLELDDEMPPFQGDATQIRQIILNLLTNASEALPESGGVITLRTGVMHADHDFFLATVLNEQLPEGDYLYLEVQDTGSGMTPDTLKQIFDPFFTTKFKGRGLGLAALLGIVRSHRGSIRVTSEWGVGTTFRIVFPIEDR